MTLQLTILIVEDYEAHRIEITEKIRKLARKKGHLEPKILTASKLDEAITHVKTYPIDAIILDYELKENPQDVNSSKKYGDVLIDRLTKYNHRSMYILLRSQYEDNKFYELRKKVIHLGFGFDFCGKNESAFELDTKYNSIVNWVKEKPLPYPLAYLLNAVDAATDSEKFSAMIDFIEISVRYFTVILLADIAYREVGTIEKKFNFSNYTFGGWLNALKTLIKLEEKSNKILFIPELKEILSQEIFDSFDYFLDLRNDNAHDLRTKEPVIRARLADEIKPKFNHFKDTLYFLYRYPLSIIENIQFDENKRREWLKYADRTSEYKDWYEYSTNSLMNLSIPAKSISFSSQEKLFKNKVYMANWNGEFLSLHPFISFHYPPKEFVNRAFFLIDGVNKEKKEILYRAIHPYMKFSDSTDFEEFVRLLSRAC
jgi:CheY-like chemotaxis protein